MGRRREGAYFLVPWRSLKLIECEGDSESERLLETNKKGQFAISRKLALVEAATRTRNGASGLRN